MRRLQNCPMCRDPFDDDCLPCSGCDSGPGLYENKDGDLYAIAKPTRNIANSRVRGVWQAIFEKDGRQSIYLRCFICGWLNNISDHYVRVNGCVSYDTCVTCPKCHTHLWPKLQGWERRKGYAKKADEVAVR